MKRQVILLGKGDLSIRIGEWFMQSPDYHLQAVVPVIPEPTWTGSLASWARAHHLQVVESGHFRDLPGVQTEAWHVDLALSVFYDKIIREWFIQKCGRILNLHNGPLPKYRGVSPINWALKNGEVEHGVTIHEITPGIDDGPIVSQVKYSIYPDFDEVIEVYRRAQEFGWLLFQQTMPLLDRIRARPQAHDQAIYYSQKDNDRLHERRNFTRETSLKQAGSRHGSK
jgi:methionyl-tRNA formyltransferase